MKILGFPVFSSLFFRLILLDFLNKVEYHRTISGEKWLQVVESGVKNGR